MATSRPHFPPGNRNAAPSPIPSGGMAAPGPAPGPPDDGAGEPGDGTAASGYRTPDLGPATCQNCVHFQEPSSCDHPAVIADPEVQGQVDPGGWCNTFKSAGAQQDAEQINSSVLGEPKNAQPNIA
jgi:hypothetical protein